MLRVAVFLTILSALSIGLHRYVYVRLVRDAVWSPRIKKAATALIVLLAILPVASITTSRLVGREAAYPLAIVAMTWLGLMFYVVLGTLVADLIKFVAVRAQPAAFDEERRAFLSRSFAVLVTALTAGIAIHGVRHALQGPKVKRVRVPLARLSSSKSGYRIVQLTDIHIGPIIERSYIEALVEDVNRLEADLVVITGDLVDGSVDDLRAHAAPLGDLRAKDGVFFVTGNHEYYSGADAWIEHLSALGIRTLRNERVAIGGDDGFDLAGVDDLRSGAFEGHGPDVARALSGRDPSRALVLLAHQPKQAFEAAELGADLQLSGHTHAGQIRPFDFLVRLEQPFLVGLHRVRDMTLYVSPGTGFWGPPMRVGTTSEITELVLERA